MSAPLSPLAAGLLARRCDPDSFTFETTADLESLDQPLGQDRAVAALKFGIAMRSSGYNLFALGPEGTGKVSFILEVLRTAAARRPAPDDWVYVHNFEESYRPKALRLPPGRGASLKRDMTRLVDDLRLTLPLAFEAEEYRQKRREIDEAFKEHHDSSLREIQERAAKQGISVMRTPVGLALAPVRDGEVVGPDAFKDLPEDLQIRYKADMEALQDELEECLAEVPQLSRRQREEIRALDRSVTDAVVSHCLTDLRPDWADLPEVLAYFEAVRADVMQTLGDFLDSEDDTSQNDASRRDAGPSGDEDDDDADDSAPPLSGGSSSLDRPLPQQSAAESPLFRRYRVNVLVGGQSSAPVIYEDHPTQPNLVGRSEHLAEQGILVTDFNLIKPGALHRANGGYLLLEARKLLLNPFAWEDLKRALRAREICIESPGQSVGLFATVSLEPEPIPLDVKVVLVGEPELYYSLAEIDPDFNELFKIAADFDYEMARTPEHELGMARQVARLSRREDLRPLDRSAMARVIDHAVRLAEDSEKLTTHLASLADLVRQADHWAGEAGADCIGAGHVQQAIDAHIYRHDRVRAHILEDITRGTVLIDTSGTAIGQVNGLVVMELGRFAFGRPSRITCRAHFGRGDLVDIEREVQLGGPIHSKGVMILSSFLSARFAQDQPLSLGANLVFEQSYGEVEGDSASSAELYCLLSALADVPLRQDLAVTGSVNQLGQVQAIGGVNEKIEGFFDVCRVRGLTGTQGVLIPASNIKHLMLRADVVEACAAGQFRVYAIETVDQGIEMLTGLPAGEPDPASGLYPPGSINRRVAARLAQYTRRAHALDQGESDPRPGRRRG